MTLGKDQEGALQVSRLGGTFRGRIAMGRTYVRPGESLGFLAARLDGTR